MKKQSFLKGSLLLTISALFAKICGALFKLPLTGILGGTGMGYFSCAYGLFLPVYAVFVTGLSTATAKPTADFIAKGHYASALKVRQTAGILCFCTGLAGMAVAFCFAKAFTIQTAGTSEAFPAVSAMIPAIFFCCLTAVERGSYEGLCSMTPTAVSQAVEAVSKLVFGLAFCNLFRNLNILKEYSSEARGAFGAVSGVTLSTVAGWLYLVIQKKFRKFPVSSGEAVPSGKKIIKLLLKIMIPASLGALVTNFTSLIDLFTMMKIFSHMLSENPENFYQKANLAEAIPPEQAVSFVYGSFMGLSATVFNLVPSLTNMLAKSVLPCTAQAWSKGDKKTASFYARQVLILTGLVAIPASFGIFALAEGILKFLFSGREAEIQTATAGLKYLSVGLVFLCLSFPVFSLLQAVGREDLPVKVMLAGIFVKFLLNLLLIPEYCTAGASVSTGACYGIIFILAFFLLKKELGEPLHLFKPVCFQIWGGVLCAWGARISYDILLNYVSQRMAFLTALIFAVLLYFLVLYLTSWKELKILLKIS